MEPISRTSETIETLAARLVAMEASHNARVAALEDELATLRGGAARATRVADVGAARRPLARFGRRGTRTNGAPAPASARTTRRGMLGTAAKVAVATAAAGVLVEQVGTRSAYADNLGNFSSSVVGTPAVTATGTNGANGVTATSDSGFAVAGLGGQCGTFGSGTVAGAYGKTYLDTGNGVYGTNYSNASGSIAVLGHSDDGTGRLGPGIGVQGETASGIGVYGTATSGVAISGSSSTGPGVAGASTSSTGVYATTGGALAQGVYAANDSGSAGSIAMLGHSDDGNGNLGPGIGVQGESAGGYGVYGTATSGYGMVAHSASGTALSAGSGSGSAVVASSGGVGYGLYLTAPSGWAIGCVGRIRVLGAAVGTATLAHGTTSKNVPSTACSGSSQVILTATSDPQVRIWAVAAPGAFTVHASGAPSSDVTFSYFLIN